MPHCLVGAGRIGRGNAGNPVFEPLQRIDDDEAIAVVEQHLQLVVRLLGEDEERAVGRAVHEPLEQRYFAVVLVEGRAEDDPHVELVERFGRAREDRREVRRVDHRHGDADEPRAAGREAARAPVRGVPTLADDPLDGLAGLLGDVVPAVHDAGDRGDRDACEIGDLADRHPRPAGVLSVAGAAHGCH